MPGRLIGKKIGAQAFQKAEQLIDKRNVYEKMSYP
jgi:hypothetical protein